MPQHRALFDAGEFKLFATKVNDVSMVYRDIDGGLGYFSDKGGGFLSKNLAVGLAAWIRYRIKNASDGNNSSHYEKSLGSLTIVRKGRFRLTGSLLKSIQAIRKGSGGNRYYAAGIDMRKKVPHVGWGGPSGKQISVGDYIGAITFGAVIVQPTTYGVGRVVTIPARPIIPEAIEAYVQTIGPGVANKFWDKASRRWQKKLNRAASARRAGYESTFGGQTDENPEWSAAQQRDAAIEHGIGAPQVEKSDLGGTVAGYAEDIRKSMVESGIDPAEIERVMKGLRGQ